MRSDRACERCGRPVRDAVRLDVPGDGADVTLDPVAVDDGDVWVEWFDFGIPYVLVALANRPVPASQPFRYRLHACAE